MNATVSIEHVCYDKCTTSKGIIKIYRLHLLLVQIVGPVQTVTSEVPVVLTAALSQMY